MTDSLEAPVITRREALKLGLAVTAGTALGAAALPAIADDEAPTPFESGQTVGANVALPALAVVALNRLAFGPRPGDPYTSLEAFTALGADDVSRLTAFVDQQLSPDSTADTEVNTRLTAAAANLPSLTQSLVQLWNNYYRASGADRARPVRDVRVATLIRAVYSRWQLHEVLVDFWLNHFSIYAWDFAYAGATWPSYDRDVIRAHALGNFYDLLVAVAQSPAMLYFLDNYLSRDDGPNENWARELFELHTLGAENYLGVQEPTAVPDWDGVPAVPGAPKGYVDKDVYGATSCFTGWRVNNGSTGTIANDGTFQYYDAWHWPYGPTVLRTAIPDYDGINMGYRVLRLVADHPGTAQFVCRKLCRRLIGDSPPQSLVDDAASRFYNLRNDPEQIKKVVRFILCQSDAPDPALPDTVFASTWGQKIKRPHEVLFSAARAVGAEALVDSGGLSSLWGAFDQMGQQMFGRRSPDGYPDVRDAWTNTTSMLYRWRLFNGLMENSYYSATSNTGVRTDVNSVNMSGANTPNTIADFWISRLLGRSMDDPNHRDEVVRIMRGWSSPAPAVTPVYAPDQVMNQTDINNRLRRMAAVILMSPEFQWR